MTNTRDYDLHDHLSRGRQLRSAAFLAAFAWIVRKVKGARCETPKAASNAC